jgi:putative tryptophan/tyrosine transport system substrate-binding protein
LGSVPAGGDRIPFDQLKRREFIGPLAASAQQAAMPVVGFVSGRSPGSDAYLVEGFRRGLRENGFTEGQNVALPAMVAARRTNQLRVENV